MGYVSVIYLFIYLFLILLYITDFNSYSICNWNYYIIKKNDVPWYNFQILITIFNTTVLKRDLNRY